MKRVTIFYLKDFITGEYITNNYRAPRTKDENMAREFNGRGEIDEFLDEEIRTINDESGSLWLDECDQFNVIETTRIVDEQNS